MPTRRTFIRFLAALPPALSLRQLRAAAAVAVDPSRLALIIGNSAYRDAPLVNPVNDAKAVSGLFAQAGFTVDARLNATRDDMMAAIERFGAAAMRSDTRLVVFYYAGHGAQLDWRNYLLPVDAVVEKQEHMKQRCVDLGLLLGQLGAARDKTFVVILDACRNNPFGTSYRPEQKGLSQFDAPVGSLLAYATAPGNVAADGEGQNGLYTEHLVRELGKRGTRIEDALKRVRLNVRLASHGAQIPWETTSLESDVFLFGDGQKKLTEAELEQLAEADIAEWTRIKSSKKMDDWVGYLRDFPNGRFAEIAQMRLTRHLAEVERLAVEARQQEAQRLQEEQLRREEQQRLLERQRLEQERLELERRRVATEQRLAAERKQRDEQQSKAQLRAQNEQKALESRRRLEAERLEAERLEAKRLEAERLEARRLEAERLEARRLETERLEARRLETERLEARRLEAARLEGERLEREQGEARRSATELRRSEDDRRRLEAPQTASGVAPASAIPAQASVAPAPRPGAAAKAARPSAPPLIEIAAGLPQPQLIAPSANPYSSGRYQLGRVFTVGDEATMRQTDYLTGIEERIYRPRVTRVDYDEDRVEFNHGQTITDLMGNNIKTGPISYDNPVQFIPGEFQLGKKWTAAFVRTAKGRSTNAYYDLQIAARETIGVPAGSFDTFRIDGFGWNTSEGTRLEVRLWLVPGVNFPIRREFVTHKRQGKYGATERHELVSLRQYARGQI